MHTHTQTHTFTHTDTHFFNCMHVKDPVAHVRVHWIWWEALEWKLGLLQNPPPPPPPPPPPSILKQDHWHVVFCPDKQRSVEPFMCLDLLQRTLFLEVDGSITENTVSWSWWIYYREHCFLKLMDLLQRTLFLEVDGSITENTVSWSWWIYYREHCFLKLMDLLQRTLFVKPLYLLQRTLLKPMYLLQRTLLKPMYLLQRTLLKPMYLLQRTLFVKLMQVEEMPKQSSDLNLVQTVCIIPSINIGLPASKFRCRETRSLTMSKTALQLWFKHIRTSKESLFI